MVVAVAVAAVVDVHMIAVAVVAADKQGEPLS